MDSVEIDGVRLEVAHIPGPPERAPLVFLHEGLGCVALWQQRGRDWPAELCAATGRAGWLYSRRGYGQSDPIPDVRGPSRWQGGGQDGWRDGWHVGRHEPNYMHLEAERVLPALLARLGVAQPVLVGHSDGATIALLHASQHAVAACVAIAPHVSVEPVALRAIEQARALYAHENSGLRERLMRYHAHVDNAFWQWNDVWLSDAFRSFDIRAACAGIATPVLAVQGEGDEYGTLDQLAQLQAAVPHAARCVLPDCGHSPHRDQPAALTQAIEHFLRTVA